MSKAHKAQGNDKDNVPKISDLDVDEVMSIGKFSNEQRQDVKDCLMLIYREYVEDLNNLPYYKTKTQITKGLERIIAKAEELDKALSDVAVIFELRKARVIEAGISDWELSKRIWDLDRDLASPSRLKEVALEALKAPGSYAKASAEKPEDDNLVSNIWIAWQVLGRSNKPYYELKRDTKGEVSWQAIEEHFWAKPSHEYCNDPTFRDFANRVVALFWPRELYESDRVGYLLKKLQRRFEQRRKDFVGMGDSKCN